MSRGKPSPEINITKVTSQGAALPAFFDVIQRHFKKALPPHLSDKEATFVVPLDLLNMIVPPALIDPIESISVTYKKGK